MAHVGAVRRLHHARLDDLANALGEQRAAFGVGPGQDESELLAAPACCDVAVAHGRAQRIRELLQELVAEWVAVDGR